jgi:hypothetical protein
LAQVRSRKWRQISTIVSLSVPDPQRSGVSGESPHPLDHLVVHVATRLGLEHVLVPALSVEFGWTHTRGRCTACLMRAHSLVGRRTASIARRSQLTHRRSAETRSPRKQCRQRACIRPHLDVVPSIRGANSSKRSAVLSTRGARAAQNPLQRFAPCRLRTHSPTPAPLQAPGYFHRGLRVASNAYVAPSCYP